MAFGATAQRVVAAETLDGLAESDPAAQRSRRDLRRIHVAMGTRGIVTRALDAMLAAGVDTGRPDGNGKRVGRGAIGDEGGHERNGGDVLTFDRRVLDAVAREVPVSLVP